MKLKIQRILVLLVLQICNQLHAQNITDENGTAISTQYCWEDEDHIIVGNPSGGSFSGCGVFQQGGQWFFNPVTATQGVNVFPVSCNLSYTAPNSTSTTIAILIWKPVVIIPPLNDSFTCNGHFSLSATTLYAGAYDYNWTPAALLDQPASPSTTGYITSTQTFVLTATDNTSGCAGSDTITIEKHSVPSVLVSNDTIINPLQQVQLQASGADQYQWIPDQWLDNNKIANPIATPQALITYKVIGSILQCSDTAEVTIDLREHILVPNAFSPNGDGLNDKFRIENIGYHRVDAFRVFNRWGQQVFSTNDGTQGWDGSYLGQPVESGNYFYDIHLASTDGTTQVIKGDILLIR